MSPQHVASFGSVNVDRMATVDRETLSRLRAFDWFPRPGETRAVEGVPAEVEGHVTATLHGGKGANQAVAAAHAGVESTLHAKVGRDHAEFDVLGSLAGHGVDTDPVAVADAPTGTAYVFVDPDGENHIAVVAGANGRVDPAYAHANVESIRRADVLLLQNEIPSLAAETLLLALAGQGDRPLAVLDPAPAAGAADLLAYGSVDVVTPNETEAAALADELDAFGGIVAYKHGPDPVVVEGEERFEVTPPSVDVVDTTGAGDVFAGYLGAGLADGLGLRHAVERAVVAASLSVEREGVQEAVPDRATVDRHLDW